MANDSDSDTENIVVGIFVLPTTERCAKLKKNVDMHDTVKE